VLVGLRSVAVVALVRCRLGRRGHAGVVARQPYLADVDPHDGVARAHAMPVQGIDVSNWQGDIDWNKVRAAGTQFAFIKATEGGDYLDPKFAQNWQAAKSVGIPRGAYHMVYWCRAAHEQALWFISTCRTIPMHCLRCSISNGTAIRALARNGFRRSSRSRRSRSCSK
jgi:lysozyme